MARRKGVAHRTRAEHKARYPLHVTLRCAQRAPNLRRQLLLRLLHRALRAASRTWFRILHFSIQTDHVHLVVEAHDKTSLSRGVAGLAVRVARRVNSMVGRRGRFWGDRYHARSLRSPREVRHAIVYVLANWVKHIPDARGLDPYSSALWFEGWKLPPASGPPEGDEPPVSRPRTWLAETGWRRHGLVSRYEHPKIPNSRQRLSEDWIP
jgi:REP element-mobilizing transposase RayT